MLGLGIISATLLCQFQTYISKQVRNTYDTLSFVKISYFFFVVGKKVSPRDIATSIIQNLPTHEVIEKTEIAGPGFINVFINKSFALKSLSTIFEYGVQPPYLEKKLRVVIDFSSPNIAKEMHVGHLRYLYKLFNSKFFYKSIFYIQGQQ